MEQQVALWANIELTEHKGDLEPVGSATDGHSHVAGGHGATRAHITGTVAAIERYGDRADVIILRLEFPFRHARMIFGNPLGGSAQGVFDGYRELMQSGHWQISYWNNPWLVLRKNAPNPLAVEADVEKAWPEFIAQYEAAPARSPM